MSRFSESIKTAFKGGMSAFKRYPAVMFNAVIFTVISMLKIFLELPYQSDELFWTTSLQLASVLGIFLSLAGLSFLEKKQNSKKTFILLNIIGVAITILATLLFFYTANTSKDYLGGTYKEFRGMTISRVSAISIISFILFSVFAKGSDNDVAYSRSFFMIHKAFFTALIYGLVIFTGASLVIAAFDSLVVTIDFEIYQHISILSLFIGFTIFIGYFPDFKNKRIDEKDGKEEIDERRKTVEEQGKFIKILFEYILVPIFLALTGVLILWTVKIISVGVEAEFEVISAIAFSYVYFGIWLHIMLTEYKSSLAKFFKTVYPITGILILLLEAKFIISELLMYGLRETEYIFFMMWLLGLVSALILLIKKEKGHHKIIVSAIVLIAISVSPFVNFKYLPYIVQVERLEKILISNEMLKDGEIVRAKEDLDDEIKGSIIEIVDNINLSDYKNPSWLNFDLDEYEQFEEIFGFERSFNYGSSKDNIYKHISIRSEDNLIDVKDSSWLINIEILYYGLENKGISFKGEKGLYNINWKRKSNGKVSNLVITLNNKTIVDKDINEFLETIDKNHTKVGQDDYEVPIEEMTYTIDTEELRIRLILDNLYVYNNLNRNTVEYNVTPKYLLIDEVV